MSNTDKNREISEPREKPAILSHWERDFRRGLLQLMILLLIRLKTEEAHGYGLIKLIRETGVPMKAGTIYPLLKRMESDELIESFLAHDPEKSDQPRRIYTVTSLGEEVIYEMMETYKEYDQSIQEWFNEILKSKRK